MNVIKKNKAGEGRGLFYRVISKGLTDQVTLEQRPEDRGGGEARYDPGLSGSIFHFLIGKM